MKDLTSNDMLPLAVFYQSTPTPEIAGLVKPMKIGGYRDGGADIAAALRSAGWPVIVPVETPDVSRDLDWVFPDTTAGIDLAISRGAKVLWANTVLFHGHPLQGGHTRSFRTVGQLAESTQLFDDKWATNDLLRTNDFPVVRSFRIDSKDAVDDLDLSFPVILKPVRGRGSQGVVQIASRNLLKRRVGELLASREYGDRLMIEEYLPGTEVTVSVMPPGKYRFGSETRSLASHWALPTIKRFDHRDGVVPYSGEVVVTDNSQWLSPDEEQSEPIRKLREYCERAGALIGARAPIRIDCRQTSAGEYQLFDLNMKPNLTGPGRPGRENQASLTALAAEGLGWTFAELVVNIAYQSWRIQ